MKMKRLAKKQARPVGLPDDQRNFWTADWQRGELEASADIATGCVKLSNDAAALIEDLHRKRR